MIESEDGERYYSAILVQVSESPVYRLKAPDDSVVETWTEMPTLDERKKALVDNGYDATFHAPTRDMTIDNESLPGDITEP